MLQQTNTLDVAVQAASDLNAAFSSAVFGTDPPSSITCGDPTKKEMFFFLDPFEDHECAGADLILLCIMSVVIFALTWWGRWLIWEPIAEMRMRGIKNQFDPSVKKRFGVTMTSIFVHAFSAFFVFKILTPTEWLWIPSSWAANIPDNDIDPDFKFYYLLYLARYCSDSVSILFEERRKVGTMYWSHSIGISIYTTGCIYSHFLNFFLTGSIFTNGISPCW